MPRHPQTSLRVSGFTLNYTPKFINESNSNFLFFHLKDWTQPMKRINIFIIYYCLSCTQNRRVLKYTGHILLVQGSVAFNMCVDERKLKYTEWTLASMRRQVGREATVQLSWCEATAPSSTAPHIDIKIPAWTPCHPKSFFHWLTAVIGCGNYWPRTNAQHK